MDFRVHRKLKFLLRRCSILAVTMMLATAAAAQCNPSEGLDFWLAFLPNHNFTCGDDLRLTVSGAEEAIVEVTVGNGVWSTIDTMAADSLLNIYIPRNVLLDIPVNSYYDYEQIANTGIHVHTSTLTTLQALNQCYASTGATSILPTRYLGDRYIAHDYGAATTPIVCFVATEDNTVITCVLPVSTLYFDAGDTLHINMNAGEIFTLTTGFLHSGAPILSPPWADMFNGMEVTSNGKRFAMFQGNECADIPNEKGGCDHTFEQSIPVEFWGKEFVIPSIGGTYHPTLIQITSAEDSCTVFIGDDTLCTLQGKESWVSEKYDEVFPDSVLLPSDTAWYLHSTKPIAVSAVTLGCRYEPIALRGDPSVSFVPPLEQGVDRVRVSVVNTERIDRHYIHVACSTLVRYSMRLNGESIDEYFTTLDDTYSTAQIPVEPGIYNLECLRGTFVGFFAGYGQQESYGFTSGMAYYNLHSELLVEGENARSKPRGFNICRDDSLTFTLHTDNQLSYSHWMLDDTVKLANSYTFGHRFTAPGTYTVYIVLNYVDDTMRIDTLCAKIVVYGQRYNTEQVTICPDENYTWRGHTYNTTGYYTDSTLAGYSILDHGCYNYYSLQLAVADTSSVSLAVQTICKEQRYKLQAVNGGAFYITWSASPEDPLLEGHEHDSILYLNPRQLTRYTATISPNEQSDCRAYTSTSLSPLTPVHAAIRLNYSSLGGSDEQTIHAFDITEGSSSRQWWIDSVLMAETDKHLTYAVPPTADSVLVTLAAYLDVCGDTTSKVLYLDNNNIYMPNVFCPSCESNNRFGPIGTGIEEGEMYIYNREGLLMYHTNDLTAWWDGTHHGRPCTQSAYVWTMRYRMKGQTNYHSATGTVTLLR